MLHATSVGALNAGVIDEARRRQRRRRLAIGVALTAVAVAALTGLLPVGGETDRLPMSARYSVVDVAPGAVLVSAGLGVACHSPGSNACDRVGVDVRLRRPAVAVSATIDGRPLKLDWWRGHHGPRKDFIGFLGPVGLVDSSHLGSGIGPVRWTGDFAPVPHVQLRIQDGNHRILVTHLDVYLSAGWG